MVKEDNDKIIEFVKEKRFIPKTELKEYIIKKQNCSDITANRKIDTLISLGKLIKINKTEYATYNITETDNRIVYIGLKQNKEIIKYVQDRLYDLKKETSPSNQKLILRDISLYKGEIIYSSNINDLIEILDKNKVDTELNYRIIGVIENLIRQNNTSIKNQENLLVILKKILKENPIYNRDYPNLKRYICYIFAYLNDMEFLTQLEKDLLNESEDYIKNTYFVKSIAECIDKNRDKLNKLQIKLNNKGLIDKVNLILRIRYRANENLGLIDSKSSDMI
jgi:uncharacterized protein YejL (UPF0352 family)